MMLLKTTLPVNPTMLPPNWLRLRLIIRLLKLNSMLLKLPVIMPKTLPINN